MKRHWLLWCVFGLSWIGSLGALGWVCNTALKLDHAETIARQRGDEEEAVRLALWRMESALTPLITRENARRYFVYNPFYAPERAYTQMLEEMRSEEIWVPSPLLRLDEQEVLLHFQVDHEGNWSSPQVPRSNLRDIAESKGYTNGARIQKANLCLESLSQRVSVATLLGILPELSPQLFVPFIPSSDICEDYAVPPAAVNPTSNLIYNGCNPVDTANRRGNYREQGKRNDVEWTTRQSIQMNVMSCGFSSTDQMLCEDLCEGTLQAFWIEDLLLLARRVRVKGLEYVQGCLLNWEAVKGQLLLATEELLPEADLVPFSGAGAQAGDRLLAMLPLQLIPGEIEGQEFKSQIRFAITATWGCVLLAATAVSLLLVGAISLSERRRRFVSAVTHELRTPLTTFRMYTEMLKDGMVRSDQQREGCVSKLHGEAERLNHLVENVLSYARLEGNTRPNLEEVSLGVLEDRLEGRLQERAAQCGLQVQFDFDNTQAVCGDIGAIDRILFNLIDNACKYAGGNPAVVGAPLMVSAQRVGSKIELSVADQGPGIPREQRRLLFKTFRESAETEATGQPGVGLGLSLSRRLAAAMGGDLLFDDSYEGGARFVLVLPAVA